MPPTRLKLLLFFGPNNQPSVTTAKGTAREFISKSTACRAVLSGSGRLVHGPLDGRCKARNWNTLIPLVPVLRFRAYPSVWSVLHTVGQRSLHLFTNYDGSPGPLSSSLFLLTRRGPDPHKGGGVY
ncbi:hypothetical protein RGQ29_000211 [Quercus rubra]|uniref:Uncharacterized protein n=1 Tax=Quercus rubra TaxID=3512 RepID=A0AAN7JCE5_QUERU|nr:hypothetical protein RGQ29_000211 [Quercus rubra]